MVRVISGNNVFIFGVYAFVFLCAYEGACIRVGVRARFRSCVRVCACVCELPATLGKEKKFCMIYYRIADLCI